MKAKLNVEAEYNQKPKSKVLWIDGVFFALVVIAIIFGLLSTIAWMRDGARLPLSQFVLQGELEYVQSADVQYALSHMPSLGTFMTQDVNQLQMKIEALPWVENAAIRKQWPNTIKVFVKEHQPMAIWNGNALLNDEGKVFYADAGHLHQQHQDIVKLYGPDSFSEKVLETWRDIAPKLSKMDLKITSLVLNDRHAWQLILDNGIRLELGQDDLDERITRFIELYRQMDDKVQKISYIDLRYDIGAAIGWLPEEKGQVSSNDQGHG